MAAYKSWPANNKHYECKKMPPPEPRTKNFQISSHTILLCSHLGWIPQCLLSPHSCLTPTYMFISFPLFGIFVLGSVPSYCRYMYCMKQASKQATVHVRVAKVTLWAQKKIKNQLITEWSVALLQSIPVAVVHFLYTDTDNQTCVVPEPKLTLKLWWWSEIDFEMKFWSFNWKRY